MLAPIVTVVAIIRRNCVVSDHHSQQYLLIQRQKQPYLGQWALIGGKWEFGESLETAILREVKEETGADSSFIRLNSIVNERIYSSSRSQEYHFLLFVCEVAINSAEVSDQNEGPVSWFSASDIDHLYESGGIIGTDFNLLKNILSYSETVHYIEKTIDDSL